MDPVISSPEVAPTATQPEWNRLAPTWHTVTLIVVVLLFSALGAISEHPVAKSGGKIPQYAITMAWEWLLFGFVMWGVRKSGTTLKNLIGGRWEHIEAVKRAGITDLNMVNECIMGNVVQAGIGQNPARQAAIFGGLPPQVGAMTINKVCGSGLKAVALGAQAIQTGNAEIVVAGGMESMSNAPYLLPKARTGFRIGDQKVVDSMVNDGLWDKYNDYHMGITGENVAEKFKITREAQDEYATNSHKKAIAAIKSGRFKDEIVPVEIPGKKGAASTFFETDESPREDTSVETLRKLKPAFKKDGTVTAGNAPGTNDGAAAVVVMSASKANELGAKPILRIVAQATSGVAPEWVMMAPVDAVRQIWKKTGWTANDVDLYELNEAFSVQALGVTQELGLDATRVNVNGGAVALGHPIGCSGARVLVTLMYEMQRRRAKRGIAALCLGGGNAVAMGVELV